MKRFRHGGDAAAPRGGAGQRFPALVWALLHVPIALALYAGSLTTAFQATPPWFRPWLAPTYLIQALVLFLVGWLVTLVVAPWRAGYRFAVPAVTGLGTVVLAVDSRVLDSAGFHLNGFFFRILLQPTALSEAGLRPGDLALAVLAALGWIAAELAVGSWFIRRFPSARRTWIAAAAILVVGTAERFYSSALTEFGGPALFAAQGVLPLQVPIRLHRFISRLRGTDDPIARARAAVDLPTGVAPEAVQLPLRPDIVFAVSESLPAAHLDAKTMPHLWARAEADGARFTHHYAAASSTNYAIFSLLYGLQAQKLEATVGARQKPLLFPALRHNGYQLRLLAASCVDWMDLKETVFAGATDALETWCSGVPPGERDDKLLASARGFLDGADPKRPVFLFVFFNGTHFDYFRDEEDRVFQPEWDGSGGLGATTAPGPLIEARARNAAHAVDRRLDGLLRYMEAKRGRTPIVVFTGDHGEEFRQKGHIGHGSDVVDEQIHVPMVLTGPGVPHGVFEDPTSHADVVPTLLELAGDTHPSSAYSDGIPMYRSSPTRFVVATVGWEPEYAVIGKDLKVKMYAGLGSAHVTDPDDRPLPDGQARLAANASRILKALRGEHEAAAAPKRAAAAP